ncbi:hypothetical protein ACQGSG_28060, partial [Bacillus sp. GMa5/1]
CSQCGKTIEHGEQFAVSLVLPEEKNMPVGHLHYSLAKIIKFYYKNTIYMHKNRSYFNQSFFKIASIFYCKVRVQTHFLIKL